MAVKKKKTAKKKPEAAKPAGKRLSFARSQKMIDDVLTTISPALQEKVNKNIGKIGDLTFLAGKILNRAQQISENLKYLRQRRQSKKK